MQRHAAPGRVQAFLDEHYGKCKVQTEEEKKIKAIYEEIGLQKKYEDS